MNRELYNLIIREKNEQYTINYLIKKNIISIQEVTSEAIKTNNPVIIYYVAKGIKGASIDELCEAIINTNNAVYIYCFARDVENALIDKLADAIAKTNDAEYIYRFARDVENAPISILFNAIEKTGNKKLIDSFEEKFFSIKVEDIIELVVEDNEEELEKNKEGICQLLGLPSKSKVKTRRKLFNENNSD